MTETQASPKNPQLASYPQAGPPAELLADAKSVDKLTETAVEHLMEVLEPCLVQPMNQELATGLSQFCLQHEVAEADLGRAIRACRSLLRAASSLNLEVTAFARDVETVFGTSTKLPQVLMTRFEALKAQLRNQLFLNALAEHGALLDDVDWRLDYVAATAAAPRLLVPVAMLSFSYREHGAPKKLTLQVPGPQLKKLMKVCESILK